MVRVAATRESTWGVCAEFHLNDRELLLLAMVFEEEWRK